MEEQGLITLESQFSVPETIDRLAAAAEGAGLRVFARIDHARGAADIGLALRPTLLLIFGNPRGGTPLMMERQTAGIDLPLKALAWEDEQGRVWLSYDSAEWLANRHRLGPQSQQAVSAIRDGLAALTSSATSAP